MSDIPAAASGIVAAVVEIIWYIKDDDKSVLVLCLALLLPLGFLNALYKNNRTS